MSQPLSVDQFREHATRIETEIGRVIVGQSDVVRGVLIGILAGGHVLLEGVPGLGKTMLIRTLGQVLNLKFSRIQFTPDLMPADIVGTEILIDQDGQRAFKFQAGPVLPTSCWPTRSIAPRPRPNRPYWKRCRNIP
jgi:MoxR-like ATPase